MGRNVETFAAKETAAAVAMNNSFIFSRIGAAFIVYLVLEAACLLFFNPEESLFQTIACSCVALLCTIGFCIACFSTFAMAGDASRKSSSTGNDTQDSINDPSERQTKRVSANSVDMHLKREAIGKSHSLTNRELEVLEALLEGKNARDIEANLSISHYTAKTHIGSIYRKINVHSQQELIEWFEQECHNAE